MTSRQRAILLFLQEYQQRFDRTPTLRVIGDHFGITEANASNKLCRLRKAGWLMMMTNPREIVILRPIPDALTAEETAWCNSHAPAVRALMAAYERKVAA